MNKPCQATQIADNTAQTTAGTVNPWQPMETAPRDGTQILACISGTDIAHVCYPKRFPKPIVEMKGRDMEKSEAGDVWEYFRDEVHAIGHSWSFVPTHWMPIPTLPIA